MSTKHSRPLVAVVKPRIGELYHVCWGFSNGIVGRCISINEDDKTVILRTPKTQKLFSKPVSWNDLRHTRKNELNPH